MKNLIASIFLASLIGCAGAGDDAAPGASDSAATETPVLIADRLPDLRAASCPENTAHIPAQPIDMVAEPVPLGGAEADALTGARFVGAWHLTSDEPNVGGLSGLAALPGGGLLAVSDAGAFVWIDIADDEPTGQARISYMRGADDTLLSGKTKGDSEGLVLVEGVALVSFERDHRILAFDIETCGAAARGALVTKIAKTPSGLPQGFKPNQGAEALMVDQRGALIAGLETGQAGPSVSAISTLTENGMTFSERLARPNGPFLVGLEADTDRALGLFRSYAPAVGNLIEVRAYGSLEEEGETLIRLSRPYTVDNFEGLAFREQFGKRYLYIVSDDNFNNC
ncbi:MAG: esterase-like activity of phytase family protein, partial [Pseudomonadota bacterium]